jgi:acyl carrier protein
MYELLGITVTRYIMDNITKEKVLGVLRRVTGRNIEQINLDTDLKSQLSLDSIQIVELFAALENELSVELPLRLMTVKTGKAFLELLDTELNK